MKKRLLASLIALCLMTAVFAPVSGTWASEVIEPTTEPTSEPTETPTETPTEAPVITEEPIVPMSETDPTEEPVVTEEPVTTDEPVVTDEPTVEPTTETTPEVSEEPTETPTETPTEEPVVDPTEEPAELAANLTTGTALAFANEDSIRVEATVTGGTAPYAVEMKVNGSTVETVELTEAGSHSMSHHPADFGVCTIEVVVTDASGAVVSDSVEVPVAIREFETANDWEKDFDDVDLTGDWREDLIAIAKTQLGYKESERNFIFDEEGEKDGYTRYGDWYGSSYAEWCAMFISFCLHYAEIPEGNFPQEANCQNWKEKLQGYGAYEDTESEYDPQPGDLMFINWQADYEETKELSNYPEHVGIVLSVGSSKIETIEGNMYGSVCVREYDLDSDMIVGYANTTKLMKRAGLIYEEIDYTGGVDAVTLTDGVKMRALPGVGSDRVATIETAGTAVVITGAVAVDDVIWFTATCGENSGYIRSDMLNVLVIEDLAPVEPETEETTEETESTEETELPSVSDEEIVELPSVTDEEVSTATQPVDAPYQPGSESVAFTFASENAVSYVWQQSSVDENGETVWTDVVSDANLTLAADIENMKHAYRCVATDAEGNTTTSETVTMIRADLVEWLNTETVDIDMLDRALSAKSLESMGLEDDPLIYVRNGKIYARYDAETGYLIDEATGLVVA